MTVTALHRQGKMRAAAILGAALCLALPVGEAGAQRDRAAVGAQVGYSRSDLTGANADLIQSRQGAVTGVYLHLPVQGSVSARPELLFSLKGGRTIAGEQGATAVIDIELAYLEVPFLAWATLPRGRFRPSVFGGPSVALQIGCDFQIIVPTDSTRVTCGQDNLTGVRKFDVGLVAGGAVEMYLPRTTLALQGRYFTGFRSVLEDVELRNRGFAVLFGVTF